MTMSDEDVPTREPEMVSTAAEKKSSVRGAFRAFVQDWRDEWNKQSPEEKRAGLQALTIIAIATIVFVAGVGLVETDKNTLMMRERASELDALVTMQERALDRATKSFEAGEASNLDVHAAFNAARADLLAAYTSVWERHPFEDYGLPKPAFTDEDVQLLRGLDHYRVFLDEYEACVLAGVSGSACFDAEREHEAYEGALSTWQAPTNKEKVMTAIARAGWLIENPLSR